MPVSPWDVQAPLPSVLLSQYDVSQRVKDLEIRTVLTIASALRSSSASMTFVPEVVIIEAANVCPSPSRKHDSTSPELVVEPEPAAGFETSENQELPDGATRDWACRRAMGDIQVPDVSERFCWIFTFLG